MQDKTNSPDEILDLVNDKDEIIGEILKSKANQNPNLLHREVAVILYDKKKRVLFQQRSYKKRVNPGVWAETCAGHVPKGISPLKAAHKELKEELGFDVKLQFIRKTLCRPINETHFMYWYIGKYSGEKIRVNKNEVEKFKFLSKKKLKQLLTSGGKYGPQKYGGHPVDMIEEFWKGTYKKYCRGAGN